SCPTRSGASAGCAPSCPSKSTSRSTAGSTTRRLPPPTPPVRRSSSRAPRSSAAATWRARIAGSSRLLTEDAHYGRALELADRGRGKTGDHPLVGAVVVRDGELVGEGWYEYDAVRHAEVVALEQAGDAARGATLYVTLEPCSHHGRTPPCADAVVAAGVARVVIGARDPNPLVDGRGIERIRAAGIEVELLDDLAARRQNEAWRAWKSLGRPFVTYKAAVTLDGRVTVPGRRWVSGEESRRRVHELRAT